MHPRVSYIVRTARTPDANQVEDVLRRFLAPIVAALVAGVGIVVPVASPAQAAPGDPVPASQDVYTTPGYHDVNGRRWHTTCEKYSTNVDRCRAEIWATQVKRVGASYQEVTGWFFNNLTYKPSPRQQWEGNPLAANGVVNGKLSWTSTEGRQWKTECDTAETGRNGCRSYIMSKDIVVKTMTPRTYEQVDRWVFNNVVQFSVKPVDPPPPPKVWCEDAPLPYNMALRNRDGLPYYTTAPYEPKDVYNPNTIANFVKNVSRDGRLSDSQRACMLNLGGNHLIEGSHTEGTGENTARWFGYRFDFSAHPSIPELSGAGDGWFSGLAQGGVLSAFVELDKHTGDPKWMGYGEEAFRSFDAEMKPDGSGGITNHITVDGKEVLWFEEYPTSPATSVLNGHLEAVIGLDIWANATGDQHARDLVNEALDGLEPLLDMEQIDVQGGTLTSYDLMRGYWDKDRDYYPSPLRYISSANNGNVTEARLNGKTVTQGLPKTSPSTANPNRLYDSGMNKPIFPNSAAHQPGWQQIVRRDSNAYRSGGRVFARTNSTGWQGVSQIVPANTFTQGKRLALSLNAQLTTPNNGTAPGASGRVAVYEQCPGDDTFLLFESQKMRGAKKTNYTLSFTPRYAGCQMLVQLMTSSYGYTGTTISYDNVELREADVQGPKLDIAPENDQFKYVPQFVYAQPTNTLALKGRGMVQVQAYEDGRWQTIDPGPEASSDGKNIQLYSQTATSVEIPERITGRNIHYGYHEHHVDELISLYNRTKDDMDDGREREFLRQYALQWVPMAPSRTGKVPGRYVPGGMARRMAVSDDPGDSYDLPIVDPFGLLEDEWSSAPVEE